MVKKVSSGGTAVDKDARALFHHRVFIITAYVILVAAAELVTAYATWHGVIFAKYGIAFHAAILFALFIHSALTLPSDPEFSRFLTVLIIAPLIRILSLALPVTHFGYIAGFAIISIPVYIAIFTFLYIQRITPRDVALALPKLKHLPLELATILFAVPFGILEYYVLKPGILVAPSFEALLVPSLVMLACTGFLEELTFRGLMQYHATRTMGFSGIIFISILFGVLHIGNLTVLDVLLAGTVSIIYSLVVQKTGSLYGVSISHGLINIVLFLIAPAYF